MNKNRKGKLSSRLTEWVITNCYESNNKVLQQIKQFTRLGAYVGIVVEL